MGKTAKEIKDIQTRRAEYHERQKKEVMARISSYLSKEERDCFLNGDGFVELPETERLRLRIDSYQYLR